MSARVMCQTPGCSVFFDIDELDARLPFGPFFCPRCAEAKPRTEAPESPVELRDDDGLSIHITKKW